MASIKSIKQLPRFDASQYMKTDEDIAWFMADAMKTGDSAYIAHMLGVVARARSSKRSAAIGGDKRGRRRKRVG